MKTNLPRPLTRKTRFLRSVSGSVMPSALAHWLGVRAIAIAPEQIAVREGLRAGVAVGTVMIVALYLNMPLMAWSAFAAFWTCLVDPGGLLRPRLEAMLKFGASGTLITGIMSAASGYGTLTAFIGLGICSFLCGLARMRGAVATQISVLAAIVAVVAVCYPQTPIGAVHLSGLFVLGAAWATCICVLAWPVDPYAPQRQSCAAIFREQARMTRRLMSYMQPAAPESLMQHDAISAYRRDIRSRIEQARAKVEILSAGATTSHARSTLLPAVEAADRIFIALMAFEHAVLSGTPTPQARRTVRLVAATLQRVAQQITHQHPRPEALQKSIRFLTLLSQREEDLFTKGARICADALRDLQAAWQSPASASRAEAGTRPTQTEKALKPTIPTSMFVRHAARLSVAVMVAYAISLKLNLPYAYWAMMAVVVVTQPRVNTTLPRTIERVVGSIAGGLLAAVMGVLLPMWSILLLVFPLAAATIALRSVNYTLCVMFMTQLFVLVTDLVSPALGWDVALSRSINNIMGSLVGLAGCLLLWPERRGAPLSAQLVAAFKANMRYAALATNPQQRDWQQIEQARRDAGTTTTQAEILYQQLRVEGLRRAEHLNISGEILFLLRKMAGAASVWWLEQTSPASADALQRAELYASLGEDFMNPATNTPQADTELRLEKILALLRSLDLDTF
ncbi:FUSC family protein [Acetobacter indonesiensis]|uniref:FUSC family protein n=1 Tax=Acetobacter indonesiensis TaxID=104101 RepID=UPI0039E7BB18